MVKSIQRNKSSRLWVLSYYTPSRRNHPHHQQGSIFFRIVAAYFVGGLGRFPRGPGHEVAGRLEGPDVRSIRSVFGRFGTGGGACRTRALGVSGLGVGRLAACVGVGLSTTVEADC